MVEQFSGHTISDLMRTVEMNVSAPAASFHVGPEVDLFRQALLNSKNPSPLKAALLSLIDRLKSENPSQADILSAVEDVKRLWPSQSIGNGAKAVSVDIL